MSKYRNDSKNTLRFRVADDAFEVAPGASFEVANRYDYAVLGMGLPVVPAEAAPAPAASSDAKPDGGGRKLPPLV